MLMILKLRNPVMPNGLEMITYTGRHHCLSCRAIDLMS